MIDELIGTAVRLVYPLRAIAAETGRGLTLQIPKSETLLITGVPNEKSGLLAAEWNGVRILLFYHDLDVALNGTTPYQIAPDSRNFAHAQIEPLP